MFDIPQRESKIASAGCCDNEKAPIEETPCKCPNAETQTQTFDDDEIRSENIDIAEILKNPCKCLHLNEPPKPKVRPCKHERPKETSSSSSGGADFKHDDYCGLNELGAAKMGEISLKEYMEHIAAPILMDGFQAVLQKLPAEPIPFLENFYAKRMDKCKEKMPTHL